jgi:hypothetical protein
MLSKRIQYWYSFEDLATMNQTSVSNIKMPQISKSNLDVLIGGSGTRNKLGWVVN